jgi:uncharacterized protein (TIGR02996 family)
MPHYRMNVGDQTRFWEYEIKASTLVSRSGKLGLDGKLHSSTFINEDQAKKAAQKKVREKLKQGYSLHDDQAGPSTPVADPASTTSASDPSKTNVTTSSQNTTEGGTGSETGTSTSTSNDDSPSPTVAEQPLAPLLAEIKGLEKLIIEHPDDPEGYLVYADQLQSAEDPRGELIMTQYKRAQFPKSMDWQQLEAELFTKYGDRFVPTKLAKALAIKQTKNRTSGSYTTVDWFCGFIKKMSLGLPGKFRDFVLSEMLEEALQHPSCQLLQTLVLGENNPKRNMTNPHNYQDCINVLVANPPSRLKHLHLGAIDFDVFELARIPMVKLSRLYKHLPELQSFKLAMAYPDLGKIEVPELRSFDMLVNDVQENHLRSISEAKWPKLEELHIHAMELEMKADVVGEAFRSLPEDSFRHISVINTTNTYALLDWLASSKHAANLVSISLAQGTLKTNELPTILAKRERFCSLKKLVLNKNMLNQEGIDLVKKAFPCAETGQQIEAGKNMTPITDALIQSMSPDARSIQAAKKVAVVSAWPSFGRDGDVLWGECSGSAGVYAVIVHVDGSRNSSCSCPSSKYPCKHAIGLMMIAQKRGLPNAVMPPGHESEANSSRYGSSWE